jgi:hypothetical protein
MNTASKPDFIPACIRSSKYRVGGYDDKKHHCWVEVPEWPIVGWTGRPDQAQLNGHAANGNGGPTEEEPPPYDTIPEYPDQE